MFTSSQVIGIIVIAVITMFFSTACIILRRKGKSFEGMLCKFMASFGFISLAVFGNYLNEPNISYFSFVLVALMFSFIGDILLGIKEIAPTFKKKLIPLGMAYFLIAHIFSLCAFTMLEGFRWYLPVIGLCGGAIIFILCTKVLKLVINTKFIIVCSLYYSFLVWKLATAIRMFALAQTKANGVILAAAILFIISDTVLGLIYFSPIKKKKELVTVELSTYYSAQILLAATILAV